MQRVGSASQKNCYNNHRKGTSGTSKRRDTGATRGKKPEIQYGNKGLPGVRSKGLPEEKSFRDKKRNGEHDRHKDNNRGDETIHNG